MGVIGKNSPLGSDAGTGTGHVVFVVVRRSGFSESPPPVFGMGVEMESLLVDDYVVVEPT